jgi:hypothetical protein
MLVFAISASAALFLILELSQPFVGLMQIPARHCATPLRRLDPSYSPTECPDLAHCFRSQHPNRTEAIEG